MSEGIQTQKRILNTIQEKMKNNKQKLTHPQQLNFNKMPQVQPLNLEQLDSVAGGQSSVKLMESCAKGRSF